MKHRIALFALCVLAAPIAPAMAQVPVTGAPDQLAMLKSADPKLAANKRLAFDWWREFLEAGHVETAEKYLREDYIQHNPLVATGREAVVKFLSAYGKPRPIKPTIQGKLVAIVAEGNLVTFAFVRELPEPKDPSKTYTTTWFDMFRIQNGKIAEHWDTTTKTEPSPGGPPG